MTNLILLEHGASGGLNFGTDSIDEGELLFGGGLALEATFSNEIVN